MKSKRDLTIYRAIDNAKSCIQKFCVTVSLIKLESGGSIYSIGQISTSERHLKTLKFSTFRALKFLTWKFSTLGSR